MTKETLELYRAMLPHGTLKIVAERAGVTRMAVSHFLNGRNKSQRVEKSILEVIAEIRTERNELLKNAGLL